MNSNDWQPSPRYPDPAVVVVDESFGRYRLPLAKIERLATGFRWAEGPVWLGDTRSLVWSDVPGNRMYRWDEETGATSVFRNPSGHANGNTRDRRGTAAHLRARRPQGVAHRVRRKGDHADRPLRRQAAQFAERHRLQVRPLDLVHRPRLRHSRLLRRRQGRARTPDQRVPPGYIGQGDGRRRGDQPAQRARVLARRVDPLHRRVAFGPEEDPRLRRGRTEGRSRTAAS